MQTPFFSPFPQRVTVLGGTGFLGRVVVQALARKGCLIRVPTRAPEKAEILQTAGSPGQIEAVPSLLRTDAETTETLGEADAVVNLIGLRRERRERDFQAMHVETPARLARLAKQNGVRDFVHLSTLEAGPHAPSRYARSKALGEEAVRTFFPNAVVLRPSQMFGAGDWFFHWLASLARFSPVLPLIGEAETKRQPVYVGDVAEAAIKVLGDPAARGRIFELGGPEIMTRRALLESALKAVDRKRLILCFPPGLASFCAGLAESFGHPFLTRDYVRRLGTDSVVTALPENTLSGLGILPTSLDAILPATLQGFRR